MTANVQSYQHQRTAFLAVRNLANQAFSRAGGAPLVGGNSVRLLIDAKENYPAWLDAIASATEGASSSSSERGLSMEIAR